MEWLSRHIDLLTLIVSIATFIVACFTYRYSRNSDKKRLLNEIAGKEAKLQRMSHPHFMMGMDHTVAERMIAEKTLLEVEIEELKKQL